jgi:hypothetical protein
MAMPETVAQPRGDAPRRVPSLRWLAGVGVALVAVNAAVLTWLLVADDEPRPHESDITVAAVTRGAGTGPIAVSAAGLRTLAAALEQPIYWAGPRRGYMYSLRQKPDGEFYIRYLPPGARAAETQRKLLIVATYPEPGALAATERRAKSDGGTVLRLARGGIAYYHEQSPRNVYLAYPASDHQVEVFAPSAEQARRLVLSGRVVPVG